MPARRRLGSTGLGPALGPERDLLLSITYIVVLSSILLQGLTIGRVVSRVTAPQ